MGLDMASYRIIHHIHTQRILGAIEKKRFGTLKIVGRVRHLLCAMS